MTRPAFLPAAERHRIRTVKRARPCLAGFPPVEDVLCRVVLSNAGLLAEAVAAETGLPFCPLDFALAVVDPKRRICPNAQDR